MGRVQGLLHADLDVAQAQISGRVVGIELDDLLERGQRVGVIPLPVVDVGQENPGLQVGGLGLGHLLQVALGVEGLVHPFVDPPGQPGGVDRGHVILGNPGFPGGEFSGLVERRNRGDGRDEAETPLADDHHADELAVFGQDGRAAECVGNGNGRLGDLDAVAQIEQGAQGAPGNDEVPVFIGSQNQDLLPFGQGDRGRHERLDLAVDLDQGQVVDLVHGDHAQDIDVLLLEVEGLSVVAEADQVVIDGRDLLGQDDGRSLGQLLFVLGVFVIDDDVQDAGAELGQGLLPGILRGLLGRQQRTGEKERSAKRTGEN